MQNSIFGDWEEGLTEEGVEISKKIRHALGTGDMDKFKELIAEAVSSMRNDIKKEEIMEAIKDF